MTLTLKKNIQLIYSLKRKQFQWTEKQFSFLFELNKKLCWMTEKGGQENQGESLGILSSLCVYFLIYVFVHTHFFKQLFKRDGYGWKLLIFAGVQLFLCIFHLPSHFIEPLCTTEIGLVSKILSLAFKAYNQQKKWPREQKKKSLLFLFLFHQLLTVSTRKNVLSFKQLL